MSITVSSTTDSQETVNKVAGVTAEENQEQKPDTSQVQQEPSEASQKPATTAPESETGKPEKPGDEDEEGKPKGKGGFQRRIDRLTKEKGQLLELNETLGNRLTAIEKRLAGDPAAARKVEAEDPEPNPKDFTGETAYEDYSKAMMKWVFRQEYKAAQKQQGEKASAESEQKQLEDTFKAHIARVAEASKTWPDFDEVTENLTEQDAIKSEAVGLAIVESEVGPAIVYHLAKNPEDLAKLNGMSDLAAVKFIGRLETQLAGEAKPKEESSEKKEPTPAPAPKAVSKAPAPIIPVASSATKSTVDPSQMSYRDYKKWRESQHA